MDLEEVLLKALIVASSRMRPGVALSYLIADLDCLVRGNPLRIRQIFVNLLGNAAKFGQEGFVRFVLSDPEPLDETRIGVTVAIEDSGIGIPKDKLDGLFTAFRQAHGAEHGGTGLGLYLSRSFARHMGGDIDVQSTVGQGSRFAVRLVLERGPSRGDPFAFARQKVLVLTRDAELGDLLQQRFEGAGAKVTRPLQPTAAEALRACLGATRFDAIILDFELGPHAPAVAAVLRTICPETRLVGLTAPEPSGRSKPTVNAVVAKPFRLSPVRQGPRRPACEHVKPLVLAQVCDRTTQRIRSRVYESLTEPMYLQANEYRWMCVQHMVKSHTARAY